MSHRRCPRCQTTYPAPARYCIKDGSPLVEVEPTAAFAPRPQPAVAVAPAGGVIVEDYAVTPEELDRCATLSGKLLDRRYQVGRRLGEGGMSYVYRAQDVETGAMVAVKILLPRLSRDPAAVERLRREATIATRLDHPNVCPILRMGEADRMIYLVMPYLEGEPLSEHETRRGPFPVAEGIPLLVQICHGLQHAHELLIIHRDLKPENIMLVPDGSADTGEPRYRAVVMDFGLAKERRAGPEVAKLTATGIVLGTPEFMSPEQIRGKPLDGRSDVYALGILGFELFTGQLPFAGKSAQETMIARLRGSPTRLRDLRAELPSKLDSVIGRCLAIDPAERYQSMSELAYAFENVLATGVFGRLFRRYRTERTEKTERLRRVLHFAPSRGSDLLTRVLLSLSVLSVCPSLLHGQTSPPFEFVESALARHRIVFLGDIHPLAEPKLLVSRLIREQGPGATIDLLALEVASEEQDVIDRYLASVPEDTTILLDNPRTLRAHWGVSAEYLGIYRAVYRWNRDHPDHPVHVLAADIRGWPMTALTEHMATGGFVNRDIWMAAAFRKVLDAHPDWRMLAFMGGYHGLKGVGGEVALGGAHDRFDHWFAGYLADDGYEIYSILTDALQDTGHGATRMYDYLAAGGRRGNFAMALDTTTDVVREPLYDVEQEGYHLEFWPSRFPLRTAVDAIVILTRTRPITLLR